MIEICLFYKQNQFHIRKLLSKGIIKNFIL